MQPKRDVARSDRTLLSGYLCFSGQDFILIICHAIIAGDTKAGGFPVAGGNRVDSKREASKVGVKIQLQVILSSFDGKRKSGIKIKCS